MYYMKYDSFGICDELDRVSLLNLLNPFIILAVILIRKRHLFNNGLTIDITKAIAFEVGI